MVRKRSPYERAADRPRPKTPAPKDGFLIHDIARLTGIAVRALRDHVTRGLLRHGELRGTLTRYPRVEVLRLLVGVRMKARAKATWAQIKRQVELLGVSELEAWLIERGLEPDIAKAVGLPRVSVSPSVCVRNVAAEDGLQSLLSLRSWPSAGVRLHVQTMIGVFVTFTYETQLDEPKLRQIAENARPKFEGMPGLRSKVYTLRPEHRQATNLYVWDSEQQARAFFTPQMLERITGLYGVTPSIEYAAIAGLVENG